jgi:hypothetical protein
MAKLASRFSACPEKELKYLIVRGCYLDLQLSAALVASQAADKNERGD